jgi:hypothetical protein
MGKQPLVKKIGHIDLPPSTVVVEIRQDWYEFPVLLPPRSSWMNTERWSSLPL